MFRFILIIAFTVYFFPFGSTSPPSTEKRQAIEKGLLDFSFNLIGKLRDSAQADENLLIAPLSIYGALALLHLGSDGTTREELSKLLNFNESVDSQTSTYHESLGELFRGILSNDDEVQETKISIGAGVFLRTNLHILPSYESQIKDFAGASVQNLDFANNPVAATEELNKWISDQTRGRIPEFFSAPLRRSTLMILATTIYFESKWRNVFTDVSQKNFFSSTGVVQVPFLSSTRFVPYYKNSALKFQAVSLAYRNEKFRYYVLLPDESSNVHELMNVLNTTEFKHLVEQAEKNNVEVKLKIPKLKFQWRKSLSNTLQTLGLNTLFGNANLKNMLEGQALVSDVEHAAEIEVCEQGTKASAVTVVGLRTVSYIPPSIPHIEFIADRPFVFMIYDIQNEAVLFSGIVHKPDKF